LAAAKGGRLANPNSPRECGGAASFVGVATVAPTRWKSWLGPRSLTFWSTRSFRRWKTNIQTLHGALAKVEQLRGVSYDLKESGKHEVGVIAEEVGAVVPEIVSWEKNGKDAQGVDYSRLTALLIEATKEQQALIRKQEEQITKQQRQMKAQQAQIETQEMQMKTQLTQIARLASQVTAIQTSLKARNAPSSEVQSANAQRPLLNR
jgi:Chaperone of endosialidase